MQLTLTARWRNLCRLLCRAIRLKCSMHSLGVVEVVAADRGSSLEEVGWAAALNPGVEGAPPRLSCHMQETGE
jgi:hypothetical protein